MYGLKAFNLRLDHSEGEEDRKGRSKGLPINKLRLRWTRARTGFFWLFWALRTDRPMTTPAGASHRASWTCQVGALPEWWRVAPPWRCCRRRLNWVITWLDLALNKQIWNYCLRKMRVRSRVGLVSYISVHRSDVDVNLIKLKVVQMGRMQAIKFNTKSRQGLKSVEKWARSGNDP